MLEGPARIWLNNLPAGSINGWVDFEEQFVSNFTAFVGPASNVRFSKVLIDNGSSINIMYRDTMQKLGIK
jgi:hypothetical protein